MVSPHDPFEIMFVLERVGGDIMEGVMAVKGSKYDLNYELLTDVNVKIVGTQTLKLELEFDHGS